MTNIITYPCPHSDEIKGCLFCKQYGLHDLLPPRRYVLNRREDISGVSGTGIVAEAVVFNSGKVAISWLHSGALALYDSLSLAIEIHGHNGSTVFEIVAQDSPGGPRE